MESIQKKIEKCFRYKDYDTAAFLTSYLMSCSYECTVLMGIVLYEQSDYDRCVQCLKNVSTATALFYSVLAYKRQKKYSLAIFCAKRLLNGEAQPDTSGWKWYSRLFIDKDDKEFFANILGDLHIKMGRSKTGIEMYRLAFFKNPLLRAAEGLFAEDHKIEPISAFAEDPVMNYYTDLFRARAAIKSSQVNLLEYQPITKQGPLGQRQFDKSGQALFDLGHSSIDYFNRHEFGAYYIAKVAAEYAKYGNDLEADRLFKLLHQRFPSFIIEMDTYSTLLWRAKNENQLGLLAKEFIVSHPAHHSTWAIIGNYYSVLNKPKESCLCFARSINITETPQVYSLLGFESNAKKHYSVSHGYFKSSLAMLENNDKALFGLGVSYSNMSKITCASHSFELALKINPYSLHMFAYLIRFWVKNKDYEKVATAVARVILPRSRSDSITYEDIVEYVEKNSGMFCEMKELILCEFAEVLLKADLKRLALRILHSVECRTSAYFSKKAMIEQDE